MNKYKYEYYSQKTYYSNTNKNIIQHTLGHEYELEYYLEEIFKYLDIFEYLKIIKSQVTATYQSGYDIKSFLYMNMNIIHNLF